MNIILFKVPITITRVGNDVNMEIHEDDKKEESRVPTLDANPSNITNLSKEVSDFNEKSKQIALRSLMKNESSRKGFILRKILA